VQRPKSVVDVSMAMADMDHKFSSSFSDWIRSESHRHFLFSHCKKVITEEFWASPATGLYALEWMTQDWSLVSKAEMMGRLIEDKDWTDVRVVQAVLGMCQGLTFRESIGIL
jgi:hypothetical protein